ncbi:MAG: 2Fe-2S iron-sulfur cluster-binding protein, partial [Planctomycetota bacterium]
MRDHLVFYLNGRRHAVSGPAAGLTLSEYLRCGEKLVGTKLACSEGDCGACTVLVGEPDTDETRFAYRTIDSCIAFVYQLDRRHIVTVEGVADPPVRPGAPPTLSTVQQAMVDCHGSQCGFCTPGFVMAIHGLIEAEGADGPIDEETARIGLSGNLCRCTGYAQILDAVSRCTPANTTSIAERYDAAPMLADFARLGDEPVHVNA